MFELVKAYESARREPNAFLRYFYIIYTKYKLKKIFFDKFSSSLEVNAHFFEEFKQFYQCTFSSILFITSCCERNECAYIFMRHNKFVVRYKGYAIKLNILDNFYSIEIDRYNEALSIQQNVEIFNMGWIKEIIIMGIYNYCVAYIYGRKSKLYKDENSEYFTTVLDQLFK